MAIGNASWVSESTESLWSSGEAWVVVQFLFRDRAEIERCQQRGQVAERHRTVPTKPVTDGAVVHAGDATRLREAHPAPVESVEHKPCDRRFFRMTHIDLASADAWRSAWW